MDQRKRWWKIFGVAVAVWMCGVGVANAAYTKPLALYVSSGGQLTPLKMGTTVDADAQIVLDGSSISRVTSVSFSLDVPSGQYATAPVTKAPFVMTGVELTGGVHSLIATVTYDNGATGDIFARFTVEGAAAAPTAPRKPATVGSGNQPSASKDAPEAPSTSTSGKAGQKLGVGGVATPADAKVATADEEGEMHITEPGTYDGAGHKVGKIFIESSDVVVQNYNICSNDVDGVQTMGNSNVTIQNNDIKCVGGNDDLNAIEFYGNNINILYNSAIDWVNGSEGGSHTDFIQTWNNDAGESSSNVVIQGNRAEGPKKSENAGWFIHQCVMAQGKEATDGGGGGSGVSENWLIADNYFKDSHNQCIKLEDIDNAHVTRNTFAGDASQVMDLRENSDGSKYYSDNKVEGSYGDVGTDVTEGAGPTSLEDLGGSAAAPASGGTTGAKDENDDEGEGDSDSDSEDKA